LENYVKNAENLKGKAEKALEKGEIAEAIEFYGKAIDVYGDNVEYTYYLGRSNAYICDDKFDEALGDIESTLKLKPDCLEALLRKAELMKLSNKLDKAAKIYKEGTVMFPYNADLKLAKSVLKQQMESNSTDSKKPKSGWLY